MTVSSYICILYVYYYVSLTTLLSNTLNICSSLWNLLSNGANNFCSFYLNSPLSVSISYSILNYNEE